MFRIPQKLSPVGGGLGVGFGFGVGDGPSVVDVVTWGSPPGGILQHTSSISGHELAPNLKIICEYLYNKWDITEIDNIYITSWWKRRWPSAQITRMLEDTFQHCVRPQTRALNDFVISYYWLYISVNCGILILTHGVKLSTFACYACGRRKNKLQNPEKTIWISKKGKRVNQPKCFGWIMFLFEISLYCHEFYWYYFDMPDMLLYVWPMHIIL